MDAVRTTRWLVALVATVQLLNATTLLGQDTEVRKAPQDFLTMAESDYTFDETVEILRAAIEEENLMVVHEINAQKMLRMVGVETGGMKQILFFHPRLMKRLMEINKQATIEPPLKIAIMEKPNGEVMVRYITPSVMFSRYKGLVEMGAEMDALVARIVTAIKS